MNRSTEKLIPFLPLLLMAVVHAPFAHPSGKKLLDVGDLVIDNCAPYGDASQEVEGLPVKALPVSGIGFIACLWAIVGEAIESMLAKGLTPHVYMSHNREGGPEFNEKSMAEYNKTGY